MAEFAGIDLHYMGRIERDERNVTILNIQKIAKALLCRVSDLLTDADM